MNEGGTVSRRILLAGGRPEVRSALRLLLELETDLAVVAEATDSEGLLAQIATVCPDLVMLDWDLSSGTTARLNCGSIPTIPVLRSHHPSLCIVVLGGWPEQAGAALLAGADGFVSKVDPPDRVLRAVRANAPIESLATSEGQVQYPPPGQ